MASRHAPKSAKMTRMGALGEGVHKEELYLVAGSPAHIFKFQKHSRYSLQHHPDMRMNRAAVLMRQAGLKTGREPTPLKARPNDSTSIISIHRARVTQNPLLPSSRITSWAAGVCRHIMPEGKAIAPLVAKVGLSHSAERPRSWPLSSGPTAHLTAVAY